ncbi:hypothetical protein Hden_2558 [Hyphomicrobium denitrificans ATCC 51888]|uniref:Uncharacterized protein n=1 Tax=Hyphomicrobium denitrificans (strain ATCC 51888 / DSM 1869 / NCIMB 11706 / TK 0415) TaxID=582899 RepID=D8JSR0_HYPDA|nr:hypothetical protein [Hyphomicrobium denitrificans]ADJ24354.1 hypothetical protein Hden_2558 [Hyphomicrobium denitrificans ATCC 51888]
MTNAVYFGVFGFAVAAFSGATMCLPGDEPTPDLLASQARDQGFACSQAKSAEREVKASRPNEAVWILKCENDTYRMIVIPDMAAKIEKLQK